MTGATEVRGRAGGRRHREKVQRETKSSFLTTEFWAMVAGIVLLVGTYNIADDTSLDLFRTCLLSTVLAAAYIVSRGWAKSGSTDNWDDRRY
jgi:hypothetical protein